MSAEQPGDGTDPILSLGWFRTGSTFLYRTLREGLPEVDHFYEPFNPFIPRIFDQSADQEQLFAGKRSLFQAYESQEAIVKEWFDPAFGQSNFFLDGAERHDEMDRYLVELASAGDPVHFQMNRGLGRLDYLRGLFPSAKSLLIIRNPWAIWSSWHGYPSDPYGDDLDRNKYQQANMLKELSVRLPDESLEYWGLNDHDSKQPLDTFLGLWGFLHYLVLQQIDDYEHYHVVRYEDLVTRWENSLELIEEDLDVSLDREGLPEPHDESVEKWRGTFDSKDVETALERVSEDAPTRSMLEQFEYI